MGNVLVNEASLQNIADAIRVKNGSTEKYLPSEMPSAIEGIQSGGTTTQATEYMIMLGECFKNVNFEPLTELHIKVGTKLENPQYHTACLRGTFFGSTGLKKIKISTKESDVLFNIQNLMYNCKELEVFDLTDFKVKLDIATQAFYGCNSLREIKGILDFSNVTNTSVMFNLCYALESISFKENTIHSSIAFNFCSLLSDESIESIIDGLATVETSQTLTFPATVKAKLTDAQISQITSKNWTLA